MLIKSLKLRNFFFDIRLSMYCLMLLSRYSRKLAVRQRSLGLRKINPIMVDFGYNNNAIRNQKLFKPIANGNVTDSGMIALTEGPLPRRKPKIE